MALAVDARNDFTGDFLQHFSYQQPNFQQASRAMTLDGQGRIVVATWIRSDDRVGLSRFNSNGTPDTSFGQGGFFATDVLRSSIFNPMVRQPAAFAL